MAPLARVWALLLLGLGSSGCSGAGGSLPASEPHDLLNQPITGERQLALSGRTVTLPSKGRVTVVDFWATWCKPCQPLLPELEALSREYQSRGLAVIGVAADDNPGLVSEAVKRNGLTFEQVVDGDASIRGAFHVKDLPRTLVLDKTGRVRFVAKEGASVARDLRAAVDAVLREGE